MVQIQISGTHSELSSLLKGQNLSLRLSKSTLRDEPSISVVAIIGDKTFPLGPIQPKALAALLEP